MSYLPKQIYLIQPLYTPLYTLNQAFVLVRVRLQQTKGTLHNNITPDSMALDAIAIWGHGASHATKTWNDAATRYAMDDGPTIP